LRKPEIKNLRERVDRLDPPKPVEDKIDYDEIIAKLTEEEGSELCNCIAEIEDANPGVESLSLRELNHHLPTLPENRQIILARIIHRLYEGGFI